MKFTLAILAATLTAVTAYPTMEKRQSSCSLDQLGHLSVTASADQSGKVRWDLFTISSGAISQGDLAWFNNDQPNGNEVFTATAGSAPNLFTFQRLNAQKIGVSGSTLQASDTATTFKVTCNKCNDLASGNDLAAQGCTFETTDGTNGLGQCMTFTGAPATVITTACDSGDNNQQFGIFTDN